MGWCRSVDKDGFHWELRKRYSEFHFLYTNVQEHCRRMRAGFPPKTVRQDPSGGYRVDLLGAVCANYCALLLLRARLSSPD